MVSHSLLGLGLKVAENFDELFDQRQFRRVAALGQARVNFGGRWHNCQIVDLSGGGGRFRAQIKPLKGASVLIQMRGLGIVRAKVADRSGGTFSVSFNTDDYDVDALVDNLMLQTNAELLAGASRDNDKADGQDNEAENKKKPKAKVKATKAERDREKALEDSTGKRLRAILNK